MKYFFLYGPPVWFHQVSGHVPRSFGSYKYSFI